ncbi:MAG: hypothetical protein VX642_15860 [Bdellovibrionota bacterium]|nr:hypothetical protein [Bdellovibrionota bacterium]
MNYKSLNLKVIIFSLLTSVVVSCADDSSNSNKQGVQILEKTIQTDRDESIKCNNNKVFLPKTDSPLLVSEYILEIMKANRGMALSKMSIKELQGVYRSCVRHEILKKLKL